MGDHHPTLFDQEEWRPVPGWEGYYEVSSYGTVRSVDRTILHPYIGTQFIKGRTMKPHPNASGHLKLTLQKDGTKRSRAVHQLVAEAFIGPRPDGHEVRHWDDNPANNHVSNLSYGTPSDNRHDSVRNGTHYESRRTHCERGHEFTPENTRPQHNGRGRVCVTCKRMRSREYYRQSLKHKKGGS